jgi:hypothetical protein
VGFLLDPMASPNESTHVMPDDRSLRGEQSDLLLFAEALSHGATVREAIEDCRARGLPQEAAARVGALLSHHKIMSLLHRRDTALRSFDWLVRVYASLDGACGKASRVDEVEQLDSNTFLANYYFRNQPVVVRGLAKDWPATRKWDERYLAERCGDVEVDILDGRERAPVEFRNNGLELRKRVRFADFLAEVFSGRPNNDSYLTARTAFFKNPGVECLLHDVGQPEFVEGNAADDIRCWIGACGTRSEFHFDSPSGLFVQLVGTKTFEVLAPWYITRATSSDLSRGVCPTPLDATTKVSRSTLLRLDAGDALFIPTGWWHAVDALTPSISLNFLRFRGVRNEFPVW